MSDTSDSVRHSSPVGTSQPSASASTTRLTLDDSPHRSASATSPSASATTCGSRSSTSPTGASGATRTTAGATVR